MLFSDTYNYRLPLAAALTKVYFLRNNKLFGRVISTHEFVPACQAKLCHMYHPALW